MGGVSLIFARAGRWALPIADLVTAIGMSLLLLHGLLLRPGEPTIFGIDPEALGASHILAIALTLWLVRCALLVATALHSDTGAGGVSFASALALAIPIALLPATVLWPRWAALGRTRKILINACCTLTLATAALSALAAGVQLYSGLNATASNDKKKGALPVHTWIERSFDADQLRELYRGWDWLGTNLTLSGWFVARSAGTYLLDITSMGHREVSVDGVALSQAAPQRESDPEPAAVELEPGVHSITVQFSDLRRSPILQASWTIPGGQPEPIPLKFLYARRPTNLEVALAESAWTTVAGSFAIVLLMASLLLALGSAIAFCAGSEGVRRCMRWFAVERRALLVLVIIGLGARLVMAVSTRTILWPDSIVYHHQAFQIAHAHDFGGIHRGPVFPALLSIVLTTLHGSAVGLTWVNFQRLLGLISTLFVYKIARRVTGPVAAFGCAVAFSLHTLLLNYETVVQTELLFTALLCVQIWLLFDSLEAGTWWRFLAIGLLGGVLTLTRPVAQLLIVIVPLIILIHRRGLRRALVPAGTVFVAGMLVIGPWMYYKHRTEGYWGISLEGGRNLFFRVYDLDGLPPPVGTHHPDVANAYRMARHDREVTYYAVQGELKDHWKMTPLEVDRAMFGFALEGIKEHPLHFFVDRLNSLTTIFLRPHNSVILLWTARGPWLCGLRPKEDTLPGFPTNQPEGFRSARDLMAAWMEYGYLRLPILIALFLVGSVVALAKPGPKRAFALVLLVSIFYFTGTATAFNLAEDRYRLPIDAAILALAFLGLEELGARDPLTRLLGASESAISVPRPGATAEPAN